MPQFINPDSENAIKYDLIQSRIESGVDAATGTPTVFFSTPVSMAHSEIASIIVPSGTAGLQLYINNSKYFANYVPNYMANYDTNYWGSQQSINKEDASFSAHWVNVTNDKVIILGASAFYINTTCRWMRFSGSGVTAYTGSSTAVPFAWLWTNYSEPMN